VAPNAGKTYRGLSIRDTSPMFPRNCSAKKKKGTAEAGEVGYSTRNNDAERKEKKEKKKHRGRGEEDEEDTSRGKKCAECYVRSARLIATSLREIPCQNRQRGIQWREARGHG